MQEEHTAPSAGTVASSTCEIVSGPDGSSERRRAMATSPVARSRAR